MEVEELHQFEGLIRGLIENDYASCSDFLEPRVIEGLRENMVFLHSDGDLKRAGIGNNHNFQKDELVRRDQISWLEEDSTNEFEQLYMQKVWRFIDYLNHTCFTSITSLESHYAHYGPGSFYKRHIDQFKTEKGRKFSIVLYLNEDWKPEDGGLLSLYPEDGSHQTVSPTAGLLVFFRSDEMEHEVHPSLTRARRSIAGWFKN